MNKDWRDIVRVLAAARDQKMAALAGIRMRERQLDAQVREIEAEIPAQMLTGPESTRAGLGNWLAWSLKKRAELQSAIALMRVEETKAAAELARVNGRYEAAKQIQAQEAQQSLRKRRRHAS